MNITCIRENSVLISEQSCSCYRGFYGPNCENRILWYSPVMITVHITQSIILVGCLIWSLLTIRHSAMRSKLTLNLSSNSLLVHVIAILIRLCYLWFPSRSVLLLNQDSVITNTGIVLVYTFIVLEMNICVACVGFWYDVMKKIGKIQISNRTLWFIGIGSISFLLGSIVGMVLIISGNIAGSILVLIPMLGNIIGIVITLIMLSRIDIKSFNEINTLKRKWAIISILCIIICWVIYFLSMVSVPILSNFVYLQIVPDFLFRTCETTIAICINILLDFRFKSLYSIIGIDIKSSTSSTKTKSGTSSSK